MRLPLPTVRRALPPLATVAAALLAAACSDAATAPSASPSAGPRRTTAAVDTTYGTFSYDPSVSYDLSLGGGHRLQIPAGAVCNPATSGYGPTTWDAACAPLAQTLTFSVKTWRDPSGRPRMQVSPDVRFVPGANVVLRMKDDAASASASSAILWCPTGATRCVDESLQDAALLTRGGGNGFVYRRLKHFSGYTVVVDRAGGGEDNGFGF
ncbi:hypothetical protein [Roseisolibacter sp. H3M3-2]|uniref:hypothetical protein n=1 Tax=Roseisolibacter sp. H3M3-2 TaxID=3031323 RepID=UPI0023D97CC9|nr:hypothetical protein [Roseisolibacter sp. H3M3-2]MDF1503707.1 hypothetical protein [Roseisolibacter sp. H3M3-2]